MKRRIVLVIAICLVLIIAAFVVAEINLAQTRKSSIAVSTWVHKSQGVQDADRTTVIAQKAKIKKNKEQIKKTNPSIDPDKAPEMLSQIDKNKMKHYKVINSALILQNEIYKASAKNSSDPAMLDRFKTESNNARSSLKDLRKLTDEQINIYKATTKDQQAIDVANATYYTWENAVDGLSADPIEDGKLAALDKKIQDESEIGINKANEQAKSVSPEDVDQEDKSVIKDEILVSGNGVMQGMQVVLDEMQNVVQEVTKLLNSAKGGSTGGNPLGMIANIANAKTPPIDMSVINDLQNIFNVMAQGISAFSNSFGGFMQSTGTLAGVQVQAMPTLNVPKF